ncbi:MAG: pyruvate, phosphate dikinase [Planctomycetes bacterium]|nr:pyruvate, phosphate dikinase [Planctomycetota bacterium]
MAKKRKWVYFFGGGKAEGRGNDKQRLGGKGAGLAEMTRIGLPVPAGFTITTDACDHFNMNAGTWPADLEAEVRRTLADLEKVCGKKLGHAKDPLLVSVRSGAAQSMPGMMETILNLGLNDTSVERLANVSKSRRFAFDAYRRLIMMYGATAKGIERELFDLAFDELKDKRTRRRLRRGPDEKIVDTDVDADELQALVGKFKAIYRKHTKQAFPQDPFEQLRGAIDAVFGSWMAEKAVTYRRVENITGLNGTAVNICQMVFGNMGDDCATGVCFTRDPSTGESVYYGDLLINAQGEDVVAGVRTPLRLAELKTRMPEAYEQLEAVRVILEVHYREMQDLEFTIEREKLYMLQCRAGKRSPQAAFKIAVDQATKGLLSESRAAELVKKKYLPKRFAAAATQPVISKDEAIQRITAEDIERLFYPVISSEVARSELETKKLGEGISAVPGAACGEVVFSADAAEVRMNAGAQVILVRKETSPEDVGGMYAAVGILTATGGKTSHAAVVARGWGKCCIVGCDALIVDYDACEMSLNGTVIREGEFITLEGSAGEIYKGSVALDRPTAPPEYDTLLSWCDQRRRLRVRTNADTPQDAQKALEMGAEGIGLCRTEHMFFDPSQPERIAAMREMILADNEESRKRALDKLLPFQRSDFEGIFEVMDGLPVTIRLLDPPLHEFLPAADNTEAVESLASELAISTDDVLRRIDQLHETNPMLGHRGCRLCITYPEILEMQVRAIIEAAVHCTVRGVKVLPEIMIPLSIDARELAILVEWTRDVADTILGPNNRSLRYLVGTMIETPRAAIVADEMAKVAEFFSFGTNDLTQMTMGLSRDDAGRFLPAYVDEQKAAIFADDPFQSLDVGGVGRLLEMACAGGRQTRKDLKLGICGEHGGDPKSIFFCHWLELDYVSCSPYRVPIARMAAAQAVIIVSAAAERATSTSNPSVARARAKAKASTRTKAAPKAKKAGAKKAKSKKTKAKKTAAKAVKKTKSTTKTKSKKSKKPASKAVTKKVKKSASKKAKKSATKKKTKKAAGKKAKKKSATGTKKSRRKR